MASPPTPPLVFVTSNYDSLSRLTKQYRLRFYPDDNSVELYDLKNRRTFLKRVPYPQLSESQLRLNQTVTIFGRQHRLDELADSHTRKALAGSAEASLLLVAHTGYERMGRVVSDVTAAGFSVPRARMVRLGAGAAAALSAGAGESRELLAGGPTLAVEVAGRGAAAWCAERAAGDASLLAPATAEEARGDAAALFEAPETAATLGEDSAACVVLPHAVAEGKLGAVLDAVLADGFEVSALGTFALDSVAAAEFLEVYKGVVPEYHAMVQQLSSGTSVALEVRTGSPDAVEAFRELCGPADPEIGKHIRPRSLRARFGTDKVCNAVHCTDLPEDGAIESEYFFSVLQQ